ncbi:hypothetical protein DTO280E4_1080 [Paecilomyces variotii]|nr:hypothetical protein DTO280E4_1080 [Paecilomyces variotii]KAJ9369616.1 hypothetical protein DTO282E5_5745 [Paecilomyces variotii]
MVEPRSLDNSCDPRLSGSGIGQTKSELLHELIHCSFGSYWRNTPVLQSHFSPKATSLLDKIELPTAFECEWW